MVTKWDFFQNFCRVHARTVVQRGPEPLVEVERVRTPPRSPVPRNLRPRPPFDGRNAIIARQVPELVVLLLLLVPASVCVHVPHTSSCES